MDKKKVIELVKKGMQYQSKSSRVSSYKEKAKNCFEEALDELQKPDWISVEDELPPIGDVVRVRSKQTPNDLMIACRTDESTMKTVYPLNKFYSQDITHWHKIDKLEV